MRSPARGVSAALSGSPGAMVRRQFPGALHHRQTDASDVLRRSGHRRFERGRQRRAGSPLGAFASADLTDGALDWLYVEMGPARVAMTTKGLSVSGTYTTKAPDLTMWTYLSIYQPQK